MGVTTDISSPTYETRRAILEKKNQLEHYNMSNDILEYIAKNITTNVRDLEGALKKLVAFANLYGKQASLEEAKNELHYLVSPNMPLEITPEFIIKTVAEHFNLSPTDITSKSRSSKIAHARQIAMYLCRDNTQLSLKDVGAAFGGRDHSTCLSAVRKIEKEYTDPDSNTRSDIDILTRKIKPAEL